MSINSINKKTTRQRARSAVDRLTLQNYNMVMVPVPMPRNHAAVYREELRRLGIALTGREMDVKSDPAEDQKRSLDRLILRVDENGQGRLF